MEIKSDGTFSQSESRGGKINGTAVIYPSCTSIQGNWKKGWNGKYRLTQENGDTHIWEHSSSQDYIYNDEDKGQVCSHFHNP